MPKVTQVVENISTPHKHPASPSKKLRQFLPLESVTAPSVGTAEAAFYFNRAEQTLRIWACLENGPIRPIRINGRLAWPTEEIRRLLGMKYNANGEE